MRLVIARYFAAEQDTVHELTAKHELAVGRFGSVCGGTQPGTTVILVDMVERPRKGYQNRRLNARIKALEPGDDDPGSDEERIVLKGCLALIDAESEARQGCQRRHKRSLEREVACPLRNPDESLRLRLLVVEDKWIANIRVEVQERRTANWRNVLCCAGTRHCRSRYEPIRCLNLTARKSQERIRRESRNSTYANDGDGF